MDALTADTCRHLQAAGWTIDVLRPFPGIARKTFHTAAGLRDASIYAPVRRDGTLTLTAVYRTEGCNALAGLNLQLVDSDPLEQRKRSIDGFLAEAQEHINASYARRLFLKHGMTA
jgi:hypothetical protein